MKSESFFKGTLILITANAVSKILGAVLKIPLTYLLGENGMAIYQTAFSVYIMLLMLSSSGMPLAISRYTAGQLALKHNGNIRFAIKFSAFIMSVIGLVLSLVMFFGSSFFAYSMKDPEAALAIRAISPSIFLVSLGAAYKSCYQGYSCQTPTAVSQVIEALIKLLSGFSLAYYFSAFSIRYAASAAIFGVSVGEFFATAILILFFIPYKRELKNLSAESPKREIVKELVMIALPMTMVSIISGALSLLETSVLRNLLTSIEFSVPQAAELIRRYSGYTDLFKSLDGGGRLTLSGAQWLYGAYSGYASTVFNLPSGILASFGVAILPIVTGAAILGNKKRLLNTVSRAGKTIMLIVVPAAFVIMLFPSEILSILFKNTASQDMLRLMGPLLIITVLSQFSASVWHASGSIMIPFRYGLISSILRIALCYLLVSNPWLNIFGAIIASTLAGSVYLTLMLIKMKRTFGAVIISPADLLKIIFATVVTGIFAKLLYAPMSAIIKSSLFAFVLCILFSLLVYVMVLFLFGAVKKEDFIKLPTKEYSY